ncbi:hypothetical protein M9458_033175, partial [Cirrhinus mrigala]
LYCTLRQEDRNLHMQDRGILVQVDRCEEDTPKPGQMPGKLNLIAESDRPESSLFRCFLGQSGCRSHRG